MRSNVAGAMGLCLGRRVTFMLTILFLKFLKFTNTQELHRIRTVYDLQTFAELLFHGQKSVEGLEKVKA